MSYKSVNSLTLFRNAFNSGLHFEKATFRLDEICGIFSEYPKNKRWDRLVSFIIVSDTLPGYDCLPYQYHNLYQIRFKERIKLELRN